MAKVSLRRKLTLWIIIITLAVVIIGSYIGYFIGTRILYNVVVENHVQMASLVAEYVTQMFFEDTNKLQSYVQSVFWQQEVIAANEKYANMSDEQRKEYFADMDKKWATADREEPLVKAYLDSNISRRLINLVKNEYHITEAFITDKFGGLVAASLKTDGFYQGDKKWWKEAFNAGKGRFFIEDISWDESVKEWSMLFVLPMTDGSGQVTGICKFGYKISSLFGPLAEFRIANTGHIAVVNKAGYIIYHHGIEPLSIKYCSEDNFKKLLESKNKASVLFFPYHKEKMLVAFSEVNQPLLLDRGIVWIVFISQEVKEIFHPLRRTLFWQWGIFLILIMIIIIPTGFIFTKVFVKPILALHNMALKVKSGDLSQKINIKTNDEIEELAGAFNNMVTSIKDKQDELKKYTKDLERSNKELEMFAYIASHDLREPLRMVTSYLQLLSERYKGRLDEDADEFINYAVEGAANMRSLINDLLIYSRIGSQIKELKPVDCESVLTKVMSNLKIVIEENKVAVTHNPLPVVMADDIQMVQLFQNLIDNAIKFRSRERTPVIHISAQQEQNEWVFSVADNGIGIESQYFERIFQIFQRLHSKREYEGTGVGLAICKKIVEYLGGRIWVESKPGQGTTFFFTIRAAKGIR